MTATRDQNDSLYLVFGPHLMGNHSPPLRQSYWCATSKTHPSPCMNRSPPLAETKQPECRACTFTFFLFLRHFLLSLSFLGAFGAGEPNDPGFAHNSDLSPSPRSLPFSSLSPSRLSYLLPSRRLEQRPDRSPCPAALKRPPTPRFATRGPLACHAPS